jgi:hypothetical protein
MYACASIITCRVTIAGAYIKTYFLVDFSETVLHDQPELSACPDDQARASRAQVRVQGSSKYLRQNSNNPSCVDGCDRNLSQTPGSSPRVIRLQTTECVTVSPSSSLPNR